MGNERLIQELRTFVAERDWSQFHTPSNLAKSISIEAAELLECFQWNDEVTPDDLEAIKDELADVLTYCFLLADKLHLHPESLILEKLEKTKAKYPVDKARGKSVKYDRLDD
jgi:NTP pyrophosphatase (non-canonical NTP hydrolase)